MKKKVVAILTGALAASMLLSGCAASKGLETDELKISMYKGVEVEEVEKPEEVTDEDVENTINATLQSNATMKEITDRAVESGDTATIDFVGKMDGEEFDGGSSTDYPLEIGSGQFIDGFEDSVIGHEIGETYDWNGKFPDDYGNTDLAGKDVVFTITVKSIAQTEVPELTDDFVKQVSEESANVKEYKEEVKKQLEEDNEQNYEDSLTQEAWDKVLENTEVKKYPEDEVKEFSDSLIEQYKTAAEYYGQEYEDFIETQMGTTVEDFEQQVEDVAKENIKQKMATEAIADKEKIKMDDETYEKELKELADLYGYTDVDSLKEAASEEDLKDIVLNNLVKEWVREHCVQVASK
ncbi:trigger factor [Dorea sp. YH-dor226]|uniref:trigger factor n=1 Tax=Dorea sp. YH-dor226 TaxID=3151119 RepID=UPI003241E163